MSFRLEAVVSAAAVVTTEATASGVGSTVAVPAPVVRADWRAPRTASSETPVPSTAGVTA
ncbi:anti-sigma factor RsiW [Microbacterium sp. SORGH_AS 505]|uniref:hypothetical protein n=1 Tax=Microbacterium sp. SORGH_AS_0505 TaxID=3041770 RepID=UPI0027802B6A|nr:hypothetical protein [Microbacterium sp. SORGH_AS_0505]MDQ1125368.1 anti-sigma factor RsiW [Microbacterium sp. SORGH_AS_0505]